MSKELMYVLITKMHLRLNEIIENRNYDLLNEDVQHYSRRLDKVLSHYNKVVKKDKSFKFSICHLDKITKCAF